MDLVYIDEMSDWTKEHYKEMLLFTKDRVITLKELLEQVEDRRLWYIWLKKNNRRNKRARRNQK